MKARFNLLVAVLLMLVMSCSDSSDPTKIANSNIVGPEGGQMSQGEDIKIVFPPGAVTKSTQILMNKESQATTVGAMITSDDFVILPARSCIELWPQDIQFQEPVYVQYYGQTTWYQPIPGRDSKYFYNWKPVTAKSQGFTTTNFSKFLTHSDIPSKDILVFSGVLSKFLASFKETVYETGSSSLRGYKAVYDAANTRYSAVVNLSSDRYVVYLFFEEPPVNNKSYTVMDAYTNGYGRANTSQIELGFSSGCSTTTCDYLYRSRTGQVKYFIQNGVHKVLFKNVSFTDPTTKEEMQIDGYAILK